MRSLSSLGLGLSLVFGSLLLALVAELYYLLWWKKRIGSRDIEDDTSSPSREFMYMFCWKKPSSFSSTALNPQELCSSDTQVHEPESQLNLIHPNNYMWLGPFEEDSVQTELLRLQNLTGGGPSRFLFTIKEETKEDLESEDGKSRAGDRSRKGSRSRRLSDLTLTVETPFLTPLASPSYFTPPLSPGDFSSSNNHNGFNPLFESSSDAEFNRIRASPPPKFKFLTDAEDKLHRVKLMDGAEIDVHRSDGSVPQDNGTTKAASTSVHLKDEDSGSFITVTVAKNKEREINYHHPNLSQHPSSSSRVLPLAASPPTTFRRQSNKKPNLH